MRLREQMVNVAHRDVRGELLQLGMSRYTAEMAIPFVWLLPSTSDPYSPVIIMIVEAIQHRLRTMGVRTKATGHVDDATNRALTDIVGRNWTHVPWITVIGFVLRGRPRPTEDTMGFGSLGDYDQHGYYGSLGQVPTTAPFVVNDKGTCVPVSPAVLAAAIEMQKQANRVLKASGKSLLKVDGLVGKKTVNAVNSILGSSYDCNRIISTAATIAAQIKAKADAGGAPSSVQAPPSLNKPVIETDPRTGQEVVTYKASLLPFDLSDPMTLAAVGIGGLLLWSAYKQAPKKKKAKKPRRRRKRRLPKRRITRTYY